MTEKTNLSIREACVSDRQTLANFIHFEVYVHRHLDWRQPLDWINHNPFFIASSENKIIAAIACPPDPANIAWIRLLAISSDLPINNLWLELLKKVIKSFKGEDEVIIDELFVDLIGDDIDIFFQNDIGQGFQLLS